MIQPYFDPTNYFQGGSVFSQYLQGFVKERSAMNKQMMEIALAQSDPSFLQDQIQIMNKNIIELEKAKAKALQGDTKYNKQLMSLVTQQMNKESQGILEVGREQVKRGGKAATALSQATGQVATVLGDSSLSRDGKEAGLLALFGKTSDPEIQDALSIVIKERAGDAKISIDKAIPPTQRNVEKETFVSQGSADRVQMPDARTQTKKALKIMEEIGGGGTMSPQDQAALTAQIDAAIAKYEAQRAGYEQQLADLQEGGVDPFSGFSRNYMLDNPFIQMSRSQGKVDALASAIEAAQQEDFRTPFARVEREAATPRDILSGNVYDEDDQGLAEAYANYMQKLEDAKFKQPSIVEGGDFPFDMGFDYNQDKIDVETDYEPIFEAPNVTDQEYNFDSRAFVPTVNELSSSQVPSAPPPIDFRGLGTDVMGDRTFPEPGGPPAVSMDNRPALAPPVREKNIYDAEPLKPFLNSGDIYYLMKDGEVHFVPRTREAVDALRKQIGREPGPAQTAFEVFPR